MRIFHKCPHDVQLYSMWCRGHVILFVILLLLLLLLFMMNQAEVKIKIKPKTISTQTLTTFLKTIIFIVICANKSESSNNTPTLICHISNFEKDFDNYFNHIKI